MNKNIYVGLSLLSTFALFLGCGSDSTTPATGAALNDTSASITAAKTNIAKAQVFTSSASFRAPNNDWTASHLEDLGGDGCETTPTPLSYMQAMSNSACTVSPYFDLNNILDMMCILSSKLSETDGLPDTLDSTTISVTVADAALCGVTIEGAADITEVTVTETTDDTHYQRRISFTLNGERSILMGSNGDNDNIAFSYTEGSSSAYRGFYTTNSTTGFSKFALHSKSTNGGGNGTLFRVVLDESESPGEVYAVGTKNDEGSAGGAKSVRWTYRAPLDASDVFGVSMVWSNQTSGTSVDTCVDPSNSFVSEGTSSNGCGDGYSAPPTGDFGTTANSAIDDIIAHTMNSFTSALGETDVIGFDEMDIHTANLID